MNNEGELKKRLIEKIGSLDYRRPELDEVLDEAKKEFPVEKERLELVANRRWENGFSEINSANIAWWFKKWFGSKKE